MSLEDKIKSFDLRAELGKHGNVKDKEERLGVFFKEIARLIFCGYFLVRKNNSDAYVVVRPTCVEFYCHEEGEGDGKIHDFSVYHRNKDNGKEQKELFPLGLLHNHVSGIDITFEKGGDAAQAIRLSALIREFSVDESHKNGTDLCSSAKVQNIRKPTYLYDALYSQYSVFDGFSVQWVDGSDSDDFTIVEEVRTNVAEYTLEDSTDKSYKVPTKKPKDDFPDAVKTANGKYVQDLRKWRFRKVTEEKLSE